MASLLHTKRKAEDDLQTRSVQRSHRDRVDQPSVVGRIAEEGSLNFIIRNNDPRSLYVRPIAWTSKHLQLLECRFDFENAYLKKKSSTIGRKDSSSSHARRSELSHDAVRVKKHLSRRSLRGSKKFTVQDILDAYDIRPQG